jgi:hypothetical protein
MRATLTLALIALGLLAAGCGSTKTAASTTGPGGGTTSAPSKGPVLANGVAPVTGGEVVATLVPNAGKVGQKIRLTPVATAPIDASGRFVLRPDPTTRPLAAAIVVAIAHNSGWVNLQLEEDGSDGKMAVTNITRQYVDASGQPFSLAEFRTAPADGHWVGDGNGGTTVLRKYEIVVHH